MTEVALCGLCGEPMPAGEEMFNYHGHSGPCPAAPRPPTRYRKKPVVIEAWQNVEGAYVLPWFDKHCHDGCVPGTAIKITTLEGVMEASPGDWIIQGVKGEVYPCKPDIFAATYDPA